MGIFSTLFGGSSYSPVGGLNSNDGQKYLDPLANFDPNAYGGLAGGPFLKGFKQDYKMYRNGSDISKIPGFAGQLGAINAGYAAGDKVRERQEGMDPALANQPELMAAVQGDQQRQSNQDRSNTIAGAASNQYNSTAQMGQAAFEDLQRRRQNADQLKLQADNSAAQNYFGAFKQNQSGGIIPGLAALGGSAAKLGASGGLSSVFS